MQQACWVRNKNVNFRWDAAEDDLLLVGMALTAQWDALGSVSPRWKTISLHWCDLADAMDVSTVPRGENALRQRWARRLQEQVPYGVHKPYVCAHCGQAKRGHVCRA